MHLGREGAVLRVVVADDHRLLLEALQALLEPVADVDVVGVTHQAARVLPLVAELRPDVVLLDYDMPGTDGLTLLSRIRAAFPEIAVAILTGTEDPTLVNRAFDLGAAGFILKAADPEELVPALRAVHRGERVVTRPPAVPRAGEALGLTEREEAVLIAMGRGLSNAQIAQELSIANATVKFHLHRAYEKLGVANRLEALRVLLDEALFGHPYNWL
jgi:DNA-binding NarL/FixJ family response regulator